MSGAAAEEIIRLLGLQPHPEGGWYAETWRAEGPGRPDARPSGTAIYYLLEAGQRSHWHRVDATEVWHFHAGTPLALRLAEGDAGPVAERVLGPGIAAGERPQVIVPEGWWQSAEAGAGWCLVGCTVSPGFVFEGFELAPPGWSPG